jgi:ATP-dependent Lon protease
LPILPLRDVVVYPHTVIPLFVGRERSVAALDQAMAAGREILLVAQTQPDIDEPGPKDIYEIGTVATILQLLKLPDGTVKVLVEGIKRARLRDLLVAESFTAEAQDAVLPEVDDLPEPVVEAQFGVKARNVAITGHDVVLVRAANANHAFRQRREGPIVRNMFLVCVQ